VALVYSERLQRSIDFIETHLNDSLSFADIAAQAFISVPHLYRIFPAMTGCTVGQYIRKRRLTQSAYELLSTGKRIIDIAFDYQFESQESYIRAFKESFGMTPGYYRKRKGLIELFGRIQLVKPESKGAGSMQPEFFTKTFLLVGAEDEFDLRYDFSEKMERLRSVLKRKVNDIGNKVTPVRLVGIWYPYYGGDDDENLTKRFYFAGIEVSDTESVPGGLTVRELPESLFARFKEKTRGTMSRYMYTEWLPVSGFILNEALMCDMEIFNSLDRCGPDDACDILLPIKTDND
jgi:AraC family transcriptional regulator